MENIEVTKQRILQEDAEVNELTAALLKALAERQATRARVLYLLGMLQERLEAHFSDEQRGGFIYEQARRGDLMSECDGLRRDHQSLNTKLRELAMLAEEGVIGPAWWDEIEARFHAVSFEIAGHQFRESRLLDEVDDANS